MTTRLVAILLIFFSLLYYFQGPLKMVPQAFQNLQSPYAGSFKKTFNDIITTSSSSLISGYKNYIPGLSGGFNSSSTVATTSEVVVKDQNKDKQVKSLSTDNIKALLPVVSNDIEGVLSEGGIIVSTNEERAKVGLPNLSRGPTLTASAEAKLQDMFQNQYFAHVSPSGENVSSVVTRAGYEYIVVGENLALGLFPSDASVVAAWMASPGHKRNILDARYKDIGIAVGQGIYQGRKQWLIVQHFGKPLSACVSPNSSLKQTITGKTESLSNLEQRITVAKSEVDRSVGTSEYWSKVELYNGLVTDYNSERDSLKVDLDKYNNSVEIFNTCISSAS